MNTDKWLSLTEYSRKYKVSVSTLRRRIKGSLIQFKYENGKYLLQDQANTKRQLIRQAPRVDIVPPHKSKTHSSAEENHTGASVPISSLVRETVVLEVANTMLQDLKRAYAKTLEKHQSEIAALKAEVSDLKTLTQLLESEVRKYKSSKKSERVNSQLNKSEEDLDLWLQKLKNDCTPEA